MSHRLTMTVFVTIVTQISAGDPDGSHSRPPSRLGVAVVTGFGRADLAEGYDVAPIPVQLGRLRRLDVTRRLRNCRCQLAVCRCVARARGFDFRRHFFRARPFVAERDADLLATGGQSQVALGAVAVSVGAANGQLRRRRRRTVHGADANGLALQVLANGSEAARQIGAVARFVFGRLVVVVAVSVFVLDSGAVAQRRSIDQLTVLTPVALEADDVGTAHAAARHLFAIVSHRAEGVAVAGWSVGKRTEDKRREEKRKE